MLGTMLLMSCTGVMLEAGNVRFPESTTELSELSMKALIPWPSHCRCNAWLPTWKNVRIGGGYSSHGKAFLIPAGRLSSSGGPGGALHGLRGPGTRLGGYLP